MLNKKYFKEKEGNFYFLRNKINLKNFDYSNDELQILISKIIEDYGKKKINILEIGCADGERLKHLKKKYPNINPFGVEPSFDAIKYGKKNKINIKKGTADKLAFKNNFFDIIIFGFCLYLTDDSDLFEIAKEVDRVTKSKSWIIIKDFDTDDTIYKKYKHNKNVNIRKMDYSKLFIWHPYMTLHTKKKLNHDNYNWTDNSDKHISINCIRKNKNS